MIGEFVVGGDFDFVIVNLFDDNVVVKVVGVIIDFDMVLEEFFESGDVEDFVVSGL